MAINIHFFRDNKLEKLDYAKVLEFFDELPNFKIYYTDDEVQIVYRDTDFNFSYRYLITKKSKVEKTKCERIFRIAREVLIEVLNKGGEVSVKEFGKFHTKQTQERLYRNPITRRQFYSSPKKQITLKLFKNFKYSIK